jgi:hypothetical protein
VKTPSLHPFAFRRLARLAGTATIILGSIQMPPAAAANDGGADEFSLFLGVSVSALENGDLVPIAEFSDGRARFERTRSDEKGMPIQSLRFVQTRPEPKVSAGSVHLSEIAAERAYSAAADPAMQAMSTQMDLQNQALHEQALAEMELLQANMLTANASDPDPSVAQHAQEVAAQRDAALQRLDRTVNSSQRMIEGTDEITRDTIAGANSDVGSFDALNVTFEASSERPLTDAYAVVIAGVRTPDQPNVVRRAIRVFALPDIGPKPRKIKLQMIRLPPGFAPEFQRVHVFSGAEELATNQSAKRIPVSRSDAHEVLISQHCSVHTLDTTKPEPARVLNGFLRDRLSDRQLQTVVEVDVNAAGVATQISSGNDAAGALERLPPETQRTILFVPALNNGRPVPGTFIGTLAELL